MKTDQKKNTKDTDAQLADLIKNAKKIGVEIEGNYRSSVKSMEKTARETDSDIHEVHKLCVDIDKMEKKTGDEFDKLVLEQADNLVADEEEI